MVTDDKDNPKNEAKISEQEDLISKYLEGWKRALADYENLKKESAKVISEAVKYGNENLIRDMLSIVDNFDLAIKHLPENLREDSWVKGISQIYDKLMNVLGQYGVKKIDSIGQKFDPLVHEAVGEAEGEEGKILEEVSSGYKMGEKVLLVVKVIVGKNKN